MASSKPTARPDTQAIFGEALRHHQAGRLAEADRLYRQILSIDPRHADSLHLLGVLGQSAGQPEAAVALIRQAIGIKNDVPAYYSNLANALKSQDKFAEAVENYNQALRLNPDFADAHYNLGCVLQEQGKLADAAAHYKRAIAIQPKLVAAHINLGNTVKDGGGVDEAFGHYENALALDPGNADAHYNIANALKDRGEFEKAIAHYQRTLDARPDHVEALNNLGVLLRDKGEIDAAHRHFRKAIEIRPDHAESHINEAMILLLTGNLAEGWKKYEWRWRGRGVKSPETAKPLWDGGDLTGKTILLRSEQGLGDSLQFIRYAPMVKARGARVLLTCSSHLSRLFKSVEGVDEIVFEKSLPDYDCHAPLMSLPMIFGTTLETIPNSVPYLFADARDISVWAERLRDTKGAKVGLVWAGNSRPDHPAASAVDLRRSMHIDRFAPLAKVPDVLFYSLQKGGPESQLTKLPSGFSVIDHMKDVHDFADTAALIANLDLVIGVDTSVIHLAGAMGKPVWVLSRFDGCWRWLLNREDSPWYPTLRLFSQPSPGDWDSVIGKARVALEQFAARHRTN